jgi:hypothetical protein
MVLFVVFMVIPTLTADYTDENGSTKRAMKVNRPNLCKQGESVSAEKAGMERPGRAT